jgi:DNA polymerase-3 subunit gamma/tau
MVERLRMICHHEKVTFEEPALWSIARLADGGMRDALSLLDQSISFGAGHVSEEIVHTMVGSLSPLGLWEFLKRIFTKNTKDALEQVELFIMDGLEPEKLIQDLILLCRDLLLAKTEAKRENEYSFLEKEKDFLQTLPVSQISWVMDEFLKTAQQLRWTTHPRILLEMLIVRLAQESRSEDEWEHLQKKVAQLEQKWQKLEKNLSAPSGISHPSLPASPTVPKVQDPRAQEELSPKLARDFQGFHHDGIEEIRRAWPQVLQRVKEEKITVHAWLVDGEPVALRNQEILIAFRSKIHRNTTEKPKNKQLIERILAQVFQKPYQLKTIFQEQWEKIRFPSSPSPTDFTEKKGTSKRKADDIVKKAKELFGEEVVEVRDDRDLEGGRENA